MTYSSHYVKVPGKLIIAGEYAVLEPEHKAVVIAVNRYVTACIKPSGRNRLDLPQLGLEDITWEINYDCVEFSVPDSRLNFIQNSISLIYRYFKEKSITVQPFNLKIESELDDPSTGKKYGLGSSAAVVVAVVSAVLYLHSCGKELPNPDEVFKLAAIAHLKTQKSGSGADIAASVYGGWLSYSAYNAKWVLKELDQYDKLGKVVEKSWPYLSIRPLRPPTMLCLAVGWTKESASTGPMIKRIQSFRDCNQDAYKDFLRESSDSVARLIHSFEVNDCTEAISSITQNRKALLKLGSNAGITIETEELRILCTIAERFGSGKSSGAGGGDCGIAFLKSNDEIKKLHEAWEAENITPLDISISNIGVSIK